MASTKNKNTAPNYCLQQRQFRDNMSHIMYENSQNGKAYFNSLPSLGFNPTYMSREEFSKNSVDIESNLFGINSTNLVDPQEPVKPNMIHLPEVKYFDRIPLIMPTPLIVERNQRPFPVPQ
jgi:hypothetical protein